MDEIKAIEEKATEIADNILKAIEPFLSEIKKKNEKIKELESERECLSKWLIEARMEIVELEEVG